MYDKKISRITAGIFAANCWIQALDNIYVQSGLPPGYQGCAVIDPGADAERIISHLKTRKLIPVYILLTHGHFDHIGAVPLLEHSYKESCSDILLKNTGLKVPIIAIHQADAEYLGPASNQVHYKSINYAAWGITYIDSLWKEMPPANILLKEGDIVGPYTVIHLPGHTKGSIAFWDKDAGNLFSGDTLFRRNYGRTDLPGGNDQEMLTSLKRLFAMDKNINVFPGHDETTTIGDEASRGMV